MTGVYVVNAPAVESVPYFAVKSIGLSRLRGRKPQTLMDAARHNLREIQAEQGANGRGNAARSHLNQLLAGPGTAKEVKAMAATLLGAAGVDSATLRKDHAQAIEALFSLPPGHAIDPGHYFAACLAWLRAALRLPVLLAVVHLDEGAPHMHALMLPVKDGEHVGSKPIERSEWQRLGGLFFESVAGPAGLQRPGAKLHGLVKQWAVDAILKACSVRGLPEANGALWSVLEAAIRRNPTDAMKALGMDVESVRPRADRQSAVHHTKPNGIDSNPYGFQEPQSHSCVGLPPPELLVSEKEPTTLTNRAAPVVRRCHRIGGYGAYRESSQQPLGFIA